MRLKNWRYYIAKYIFFVPEGYRFGTDSKLKRLWICLGVYLIYKTLKYVPNGLTFEWVLDNSLRYKRSEDHRGSVAGISGLRDLRK